MAEPALLEEFMDGLTEDLWLVAESDENDSPFFGQACSCAVDCEPPIYPKTNAFAAKELLSQHPQTPIVIVPDPEMPQMDRLELLAWVRQQNGLKGIPCIMLSSSKADEDMTDAEYWGATDY